LARPHSARILNEHERDTYRREGLKIGA